MMLPDDVFNRRLNQAAKAAAIAITNSSHSKVLAHYSWDTLPKDSKRFLHSVIVGSVRERLRMPYKLRDDDDTYLKKHPPKRTGREMSGGA